MRLALAALTAFALSSMPAEASEAAAALTARHLEAGTLAAGESELAALAATAPGDADAQAGLGMVRFARAIERFAQGMYRHGFQPGGAGYGPLLRMPLPVNPAPEKLDYEGLRAIFAALVSDLDAAGDTLKAVGGRPVKIPLDIAKLRIDIDGDGTASESEALFALAGADMVPQEAKPGQLVAAFDTADTIWLTGYANVIALFGDGWLAFDFRTAFDQTFQVIFPGAGLPNEEALNSDYDAMGFRAAEIADVVALIHLIRFDVVEPERLARVRTRLLEVIALNRATWAAASAETDNDREWLPSPKQKTGIFQGLEVTQERVEAWLAALGDVEKALNGEALVPHWRFEKGFNLKRVFTEMKRFDLVLWVTGHDALPFLEDGPVADGAGMAMADRVFGGDLFTYAFWFN